MVTTKISLKPRHESPVVRLTNWYRENEQAMQHLLNSFLFFFLTFFLFAGSDVTEAFYKFTRAYEHLEIDDLIVTLGMAFPVYLSIFALRRWAEAIQRIRQANTDILTGLANRRKGQETLEVEIARAERYSQTLSLILLDIDDFKSINDTYGHLAGDQVLSGVSKLLHAAIRSSDMLIRWGGEEFMIILPGTDLEGAREQAERLRALIEETPIQRDRRITASLGVAQREVDDSLVTLFERVDGSLYQAKLTGRNRVG